MTDDEGFFEPPSRRASVGIFRKFREKNRLSLRRSRSGTPDPVQRRAEGVPPTAASLNNLAGLYRAQGEYGKAAPLLERALAIFEKALGKDHPNTKVIAANLAELRKKLAASPKP
jgi:tetratricopeptide (TPR) repeat protein